MKIIVHRGKQIGGCITEVQSNKGTKIIIDIGENLPSMDGIEKEKIEIDGLNKGTAKYDAVFVTHYHGDHIGLYNEILPNIPIYIGEISKEIYKILQNRLLKAKIVTFEELSKTHKFKTFKIPERIQIKDITITPIGVDHSAFDAHMFLIECDGKKILHTGDFRTHGQRGKSVVPAIEKYVGKVDCLICEGTTLSREKEKIITEFDIQNKAEQIFKENKYSFVLCSSTNIDRIAGIHKATLKAQRLFVCDDYQKEILMYINTVSKSGLYKFQNTVYSYADNLLQIMKEKGFVMLVRANWLSKEVMKKFQDSVFIYSQWDGYLDDNFKEYEHLQKFVPKNHIYLHTSGHADYEALNTICKLVKPHILIPIHSENPSAFEDMDIQNCQIIISDDEKEIII